MKYHDSLPGARRTGGPPGGVTQLEYWVHQANQAHCDYHAAYELQEKMAKQQKRMTKKMQNMLQKSEKKNGKIIQGLLEALDFRYFLLKVRIQSGGPKIQI